MPASLHDGAFAATDDGVTALTSSYGSAIVLGDAPDGGSQGNPIPTLAWLSLLVFKVDTIASSAASITWYLSEDSAGDVPLTDENTDTLVGQSSTEKGFASRLDVAYKRLSGVGTAGKLYLWAKTDTGTCNGNATLHGTGRS